MNHSIAIAITTLATQSQHICIARTNFKRYRYRYKYRYRPNASSKKFLWRPIFRVLAFISLIINLVVPDTIGPWPTVVTALHSNNKYEALWDIIVCFITASVQSTLQCFLLHRLCSISISCRAFNSSTTPQVD